MCQRCARKTGRVLSWLFDSDEHRYYFNDTSWVFWSEDPKPPLDLNPLRTGDRNKVRRLLSSYYDGTLIENDTPIWMLAIEQPSKGRLMVRHLERATTGRVETHLARYFDAMEIGGRYFGSVALAMSLIQTANGSKSPRDIPPWIEAGLLGTALSGRPLPAPFALKALGRNYALGHVSDARAAVLKLYLITNGYAMTSATNRESDNQAYQLGRLFAVLEYAQYKALGQTNATITDRFFKGASTSPQSAFGNLLGKLPAHLAKVRKADERTHNSIQKEIGQIMSQVRDFPAVLPAKDQAMFSLGYYHQREERFNRSGSDNKESSTKETEEES